MTRWFEWDGVVPELQDQGRDVVAWADTHIYDDTFAVRATERLGIDMSKPFSGDLVHGYVIEGEDGMCYGFVKDESFLDEYLGEDELNNVVAVPATFVCRNRMVE